MYSFRANKEMLAEKEQQSATKIDVSKPYVLRLDGHQFSKFTRHFTQPFDKRTDNAMIFTASDLILQFPQFTSAYVINDEISLFAPAHQGDDRLQKIISLVSGFSAARFNFHLSQQFFEDATAKMQACGGRAFFDARIIFYDNIEQCVKNIYSRKSFGKANNKLHLSQHLLGHSSIAKISSNQVVENLRGKGIIWSEYPEYYKTGAIIKKDDKCAHVITGAVLEAIENEYPSDFLSIPVLSSTNVYFPYFTVQDITFESDKLLPIERGRKRSAEFAQDGRRVAHAGSHELGNANVNATANSANIANVNATNAGNTHAAHLNAEGANAGNTNTGNATARNPTIMKLETANPAASTNLNAKTRTEDNANNYNINNNNDNNNNDITNNNSNNTNNTAKSESNIDTAVHANTTTNTATTAPSAVTNVGTPANARAHHEAHSNANVARMTHNPYSKNPKAELNEFQSRNVATVSRPIYELESSAGPSNEPHFVGVCKITKSGQEFIGRGEGRKKKEAFSEAARAALNLLVQTL